MEILITVAIRNLMQLELNTFYELIGIKHIGIKHILYAGT